MLMPADVSLADNARQGEALGNGSLGDGSRPQDDAMIRWFFPGRGSMDYQSLYGKNGQYNENYVDVTNYNFGVVAAAAGYSKEEMLAAAGSVNWAADLWYQLHGQKPNDQSGQYGNKERNADMIVKGFEDYKAGRIAWPER
jgi:hypothetical protein